MREIGRTRRHAGALRVIHVVVPEVAVAIVAGAALISPAWVIPAVVVAGLVLLPVFGRVRGRWWYEYVAARWRLRSRRRTASRSLVRLAGADPRAAAMATLRPGLSIRNLLHRGRSIGIGADDDGWFAAVAVGGWADVSGERAVDLELDQVARILDESPVPISALQLVSFQTQIPTTLDGAARRSYLELTAPGCPLDQAVWLVVRLDPADALGAAATRGGGLDGVDRALAALIGRVEKTLGAAGVSYQVLDADGLGDALALACGLADLGASRPGQALAGERWTAWLAGGLTHVCFTVTSWPRPGGQDLLAGLGQVPATAVAVSVAMRPQGGFAGLVRVVATAAQVPTAVHHLTAAARRLGIRLRRLDGDQAPSVYATAPTGGVP